MALNCLQLNAQAPSLIYSNNYVGSSTSNDFGSSILPYSNGDVIVAGSSGNLNPFPFYAVSPYLNNIFVGKFNAVGANIWQSTISVATVAQLAKDANGNIFAVGYSQGANTFFNGINYGSVGANSLGAQNVFVAKYSPSGSIMWVKLVGSGGDEFGTGITVDPSGDVYVTGYVTYGAGVMDFEPGVAAATFTCNYKSFLVKLSNNGNYIWHKVVPYSGNNYHSVCADTNNVYWATQLTGSGVDINPAGTSYSVSTQSGSYDILLAKYRKDGTLVNAKSIGGTANTDYSRGIETKNGKIVLTGAITQGTVSAINMNGLSATPVVSLTTNGTTNKDGFIALYDTLLNCQWAKPIGGTTVNDETWGATFDNSGNVLVSGLFAGPTNFNIGGVGTYTANSNGTASDYFYASYNVANGNCNWLYKQGGTSADQAADIAVDSDGRIWATGYINNGSTANDMFLNKHFCASSYSVTVDRNGYVGTPYSSSFGNSFGFIGCSGQTANYTALAIPNTNVKYTFYNFNGVSSNGNTFVEPTVTASMATKGYRLLVQDTVTKCEQVFNIQYSQVNAALNPALTITPNSPTVCLGSSVTLNTNYSLNTYTWQPGNYSTPTATYYVVSPTVTTTYTVNGYDGIANGAGCYWSASKTVTVVPLPSINALASSTVICSGDVLTLTGSGTATNYTWTSANSEGPIGSTQTLTLAPTSSDSYTLTASDGNCSTVSSVVVTVNVCTSIQETVNLDGISVYPNPAKEDLTIDLNKYTRDGTVSIYSTDGQLVKVQKLSEGSNKIFIADLNSGIYFLTVIIDDNRNTYKIIKL